MNFKFLFYSLILMVFFFTWKKRILIINPNLFLFFYWLLLLFFHGDCFYLLFLHMHLNFLQNYHSICDTGVGCLSVSLKKYFLFPYVHRMASTLVYSIIMWREGDCGGFRTATNEIRNPNLKRDKEAPNQIDYPINSHSLIIAWNNTTLVNSLLRNFSIFTLLEVLLYS